MVESSSVEVLIMQQLFPDEKIRTQATIKKTERPKQSLMRGAIDIDPVGLAFAKQIHYKIVQKVIPLKKVVQQEPIIFSEDLQPQDVIPAKVRKQRKKRAHLSKKQFLVNTFTLMKQAIDSKNGLYRKFERY